MMQGPDYNVEASIRLLNAKTTEEVKKALNEGADPNATDENGKTALMVACQSGNTESVRLLLEKGAEIYERDADNKPIGYVKDKAGKTVLEYATEDVRNYLTAWINEHQSLDREETKATLKQQREVHDTEVKVKTGRARRRYSGTSPKGKPQKGKPQKGKPQNKGRGQQRNNNGNSGSGGKNLPRWDRKYSPSSLPPKNIAQETGSSGSEKFTPMIDRSRSRG